MVRLTKLLDVAGAAAAGKTHLGVGVIAEHCRIKVAVRIDLGRAQDTHHLPAAESVLHKGESIGQAAMHGRPRHDPGVGHGHGHLFQSRIDGAGLEKNHAVGRTDMLGRHGRQHGDAGAAKDDLTVPDLPGRRHRHHLPRSVMHFVSDALMCIQK